MKIKLELWHVGLALICAVVGAFFGAVIQILLLNYGVMNFLGHDTGVGFSEGHDFTFTSDALCNPGLELDTAALRDHCAVQGYVTYSSAACMGTGDRTDRDLFVRCVR